LSKQITPRTRLCIFGARPASPRWLAQVAAGATDAQVVLYDEAEASATIAGERRSLGAGDDAHAVLLDARTAFPGDDLVLLRSDTLLPPYWLERIGRGLALSDVLVVSPLDNLDPLRAPLVDGGSSDAGVERIDGLCFAYGRHQAIDWPTFSPLLSAWSGKRLASLDPNQVEQYVLAQTIAPLRGVLLDDLYVAVPNRALRGPRGVAPGEDAVAPSALGELRAGVTAGLDGDANTGAAYYGLDRKPVVLHVLHSWGGGAARFVHDLARSDTQRHHIVLNARGNFHRHAFGETIELFDTAVASAPLRSLTLSNPIRSTTLGDPSYRAFFDAILRDFHVDAVMVSSLIGHSLDVFRSGLPTTHFVHDFYPLWPLLHRNLDDDALRFDAALLASDLAGIDPGFEFAEHDPPYWAALREAFADAALAARAQLIAPSRAALDLFLRLQPRLNVLAATVIAHGIEHWPDAPQLPAPPARERLRLIVLGRVRRGKAAALLREALPQLREHAEIFLLGAGPESSEFFGKDGVHILLNYRREDMPRMLATVAPDAALILPNFAETFSYTLSELSSLGVPVIATRLGALAERVRHDVSGWLVEPNANSIAERIAMLARDRAPLARARETLQRQALRTIADMVADYANLLPSVAGARASAPPHTPNPDRLVALTRATELAWAQRELDQVAEKNAAQARELQRRTDWALDASRQAKQANEHIFRLNDHVSELGAHISRQGQQIANQEQELQDQQVTIGERTRWAHEAVGRERAALEEYGKLSDAHAQLENDFDDRTRWALSLDAERERLEAEMAGMRNSRSWRLTRPLRYATRKLRTLRAHVSFQVQRVRSTLARTRGSIARRGLVGTFARIGDEFARRRQPQLGTTVVAPPTDEFTPFALPVAADSPLVSIVIPVFNKIEYTVACLRSIAEHASATPFEVIVVDDGSSDATQERLAQIEGIRVHRNERNLGFVGSCNAGAALARGEFVLFLNNDTQVTPDWLDALTRCFAEEPDAGLVGAKLVYPDGRLQEAGGIVFRDGSGWNYGRFGDPADPRYDFRREADYCSGAAIMIRRAFFDELGGFDTRYAPAYYEDTDLAFAVRAAGKKVFFEPRSRVVHFEGITSGTDLGSGIKQYQVVNREKFLDKWQAALAAQPAPIGSAKFAAAAANFRTPKRVLIIDAYTPTPDQDSGSLRMVNVMRLLRSLGYQVTFIPDNYAHFQKYTEALQALGVEALYHPYVGDPTPWLRENGATLAAILLSRHYVASNYIGLARLYAPQARLIFDTVDLHYLREEREAALTGNGDAARAAAATKRSELHLMRECDVTLVVSPVEKTLLARAVPNARVAVLSNVHEIYGRRRGFAERKGVVFVGGFQHPPNIDAVQWYVREIHPLVRASAPDIEFHVVGSKVTPEVSALAGDGVVVHGYVEDIAPFMDGCRLSLAPLRYGAGVKGKVNMAMSYGLPVVATAAAVEGMHVRSEQDGASPDVLVADTPEAFAAAILRAYSDESLWNTLSANGLENVRAHFSFAAARTALEAILPG